jgi:hypothetical protein
MLNLLVSYIDVLNRQAISLESGLNVVYGLDKKRSTIHQEIKEELEKYFSTKIIEERFNMIMHNLKDVIGLDLPLHPTDGITSNARDLKRFITCGECKNFLTRENCILTHTPVGKIIKGEEN